MTVATETVESWWQQFATTVIPPDAPEVQYVETRRAFYAGAWSMLVSQRDLIGSAEVNEEQGVVLLQGWLKECEDFQQAIREGKA